jgi:hypothetical protein
MHKALAWECFVDLVASKGCFTAVLSMGLALRKGTRLLALLEGSGVMCWDMVVGRRVVSFYFLMFIFP